MFVQNVELKTVVVPCLNCGVQSGDVRGSYQTYDSESGDQAGWYYALVECPGCEHPFLTRQNWCWVGSPENFCIDDPRVIHPSAGELDDSVPQAVADSFAEAITTFRAGALTATAVMCRRTLEMICKDVVGPALEAKQAEEAEARKSNGEKRKKQRRPGLAEMLNALQERIDPRLHEWADVVVKELGNDAAHESAIGKEDAYDALEFTRALVQNLYVFQQSFEQFKKRRDKRKAGV